MHAAQSSCMQKEIDDSVHQMKDDNIVIKIEAMQKKMHVWHQW